MVGEFPTISETFVLDQITGLLARGIDVSVLARRPRAGEQQHPSVSEYQLMERTHYYRPLLGNLGRAWAVRSASACDVVLAHFGPNGLRALELRRLGFVRAPIATVFHGHDLSSWTRRHGRDAYRRLFEGTELMLPVSDRLRDRLVDLGCPSPKVRVHRVGVSISDAAARPRVVDAEPNVLSVGRLVEKKGFQYGLRAFAHARGELAGLHYHIVGDGPLRGQLETLARELGVRAHVTFHGQLTRERVEELRRSAGVVLVPSVTAASGDQEGIPVVLMEAMSSGVPVVATRHSAIPELLIDRETGLLAAERDVVGLAEAVVRLMREPLLAEQLGRAARVRVATLHDLERLNDDLASLLQSLGQGKGVDQC